jgi:DNA-binding CsgD family transcriptional regulator
MNSVAEEIRSYLGYSDYLSDADLMHYGTPRHSGRYPWGSGDEPYQHGMDFLARYDALKSQGLSDTDIAKELNMLNKKGEPSTGVLRLEKKYANDMRKIHMMQTARSMKEDGLGPTEIGRKMGINESSVRSLLNPEAEARTKLAMNTANFLRDQVDEKKMIDITSGVEKELSRTDLSDYDIAKNLNISRERLKEAVYILEKEGYVTYEGGIPQPTNSGQQTTQKVLCVPGTQHKDIYNYDQVHTITEYTSRDGGTTFETFQYPASLDSKRLKVLLGDEIGPDGEPGVAKDGIIQLRRGVPDLSLGDAKYSQVRILVDDNKYLKGMAVYSDNMPDGVDVIFNSNKTSYDKALKDIKTEDPMNPFGSLIKPSGQSYYDDPNGKYTDPVTGKKQSLSLINKRADQGDWSDWSDALPSQFLSKQSVNMAKKQLNLAKADKLAEFEDICALTNPTVKKHFLDKFADGCDAAAVDLKAAALPGQKYHVIIPVNTLKDTEIFAPQYENGTKLALIRYPHAGTFEIPILTVNNKHKQARDLIGTDAIDAVGINKKIADRLSGADFDGDTVMCIPTHDKHGNVKITSTPELQGLKGFDPQMAYPEREGMKYMKNPVTGKDATQVEMGVISNLIADMTLFGADSDDMAKAVRHSMVVIDAAKHKLDYKRSEVENDIASLKKKWQVNVKEDGTVKYGGASTIISKSKGEDTVHRRQGTPKVNIKGKEWYDPNRPEGALIYKEADDLYYPIRKKNKETGLTEIRTADGKKIAYNASDPTEREKYEPVGTKIDPITGKVVFTNKAGDISYRAKAKTQPSTRMAETDDAYSLISPAKHPMEIIYADYANDMKSLANKARIESINTGEIKYSADAKKKYQPQVDSLMRKLNDAEINSIRERAALRKANVVISTQTKANPNMKKSDQKKLKQRAVTTARSEVGAISRRDRNIEITDLEWEAIQSGAISKTQLKKILNNTDVDALRERAMPRTTTTLSDAKINKIKRMNSSNYTLEEIARACGVSTSTVSTCLKGGK